MPDPPGRLLEPSEELTTSPVDPEALARDVTISRDRYGVPHVHGRTDEAAVFGLAYARTEDQFGLIEEIFISRLGRSSELYGPEGLSTPGFMEKGHDLSVHAFGYLEEARKGFARLPAKLQAMAAAYVAGLEYFLEKNPQQQVRLLERFEPWWVVAVEDFSESYRGRIQAGVFGSDVRELAAAAARANERGSNAWAIGPARTADGHAMLLINPHDPSRTPYYECHIRSDEGLDSYGVINHFGVLMLPYVYLHAGRLLKRLAAGGALPSCKALRWYNEIPLLLTVPAIWLVLAKPFQTTVARRRLP